MLRLFFILLISLSSLFLSAQNQPPFRVVFWNTENFFDTRHDSLKNDMAISAPFNASLEPPTI